MRRNSISTSGTMDTSTPSLRSVASSDANISSEEAANVYSRMTITRTPAFDEAMDRLQSKHGWTYSQAVRNSVEALDVIECLLSQEDSKLSITDRNDRVIKEIVLIS